MRKTVTALAAAATLATATLAAPRTADARWGWWGPALGGLAVGAIVGSQANRSGYYGGGPGYYEQGYQPVYSHCRTEREQYVDQYGRYRIHRVRVCD